MLRKADSRCGKRKTSGSAPATPLRFMPFIVVTLPRDSSISTTDYNLGHLVLMVGHDVLEGIHDVFSYPKLT